jgi:uncharacterized protein (TIGR02679 family)
MDTTKKSEAIDYFGKRAFNRLFSLFKDRIESLGSVGGTVKFSPNTEELEAIHKWLGDSGFVKSGSEVKVSLIKFEKRLAGSRYEGITLWELVEAVTHSRIIFKKDRRSQEEAAKRHYFEKLTKKFPHKNVDLIIEKIINKERGTTGLIASYNAGEFLSIETSLKAVSNLPKEGKFERLPVFAKRIAGDPHYFDKNKKLVQALELIVSDMEGYSYRSILNAEEESELLSIVGLVKDDLHNFVTVYGLEAFRGKEIIKQWFWANKEKSIQNIPLRSLATIDSVRPIKGNKVFILENSGVYSSVLDELQDVYPVICTHGNFKLSGLQLMDKLIQSGTELYYSGDIDVNGIVIANHLKKKYGNKVHFWRMGPEEYKRSLSEVELSSLNRLEAIKHEELIETIEVMKVYKRAGYQESLLNLFIDDITAL